MFNVQIFLNGILKHGLLFECITTKTFFIFIYLFIYFQKLFLKPHFMSENLWGIKSKSTI